jgi:hypothetical protein
VTRRYWLSLSPSLLVGVGIIVSALIAKRFDHSLPLVLASTLLLAIAIVSADVLGSRLRGEVAGPSPAALILGVSFLLAGSIVAFRDPSLVKTFIPLSGACAWVVIVGRSEASRRTCRDAVSGD